jgi:hypothetical protein
VERFFQIEIDRGIDEFGSHLFSQGSRMKFSRADEWVLKGHDFSRAANASEKYRALASEGRFFGALSTFTTGC